MNVLMNGFRVREWGVAGYYIRNGRSQKDSISNYIQELERAGFAKMLWI
jgi:hypothetical protein